MKRPDLNEFGQAPSHDTHDQMKAQGSNQKMVSKNVHRALVCSQLRKFDTGALNRNDLTRMILGRCPQTTQHSVPDQTKA